MTQSSERLRNMGIRGRLALLMLVCGLCLLISIIAVMLPFFRWNMTSQIETQQATLLTAIQTEIDGKLSLAQKQLAGVAGVMTPEALHNRTAALRFLENRAGITHIFDNGLAVLDTDGYLIAETPPQPNRTIFDFSAHPVFRQAITANGSVISTPFRSTKSSNHPVVQISAPVRDQTGRVVGILSGGLRLDGDNVIGSIARHRIGTGGYLYLYAKDRTMLVHPDPRRIMQQDVPPGANRLFDKALTGWEGTGRTVNSRGLAAVSSFRQITHAPWILASNIPEYEAFAPARRATAMFLLITTMVGLVGMAFFWLALRSVTSPLEKFGDHLEQLATKEGDDRLFAPMETAPQEVKLLATSCNRMVSNLDQQQQQLSRQMEYMHQQARLLEQEIAERQQLGQELQITLEQQQASSRLLQIISDNVPDLVWAKDTNGVYLFANEAMCNNLLMANDTQEPIGKNDLFFALRERESHPDRHDWHTFGELCVNSDEVVLTDRCARRFDEYGNVRSEFLHLDVYKAPLFDQHGQLIGTVGSGRIVTKEKQLEQENGRLTRLYRILSELNQQMVHRVEPRELLQVVCTTLVADQSFNIAWIGLPDGAGRFFPALSAGVSLERLQQLGSIPPPANNRIIVPRIADLCATAAEEHSWCGCDVFQTECNFCAAASYLIHPSQAMPVLLVLYTTDSQLLTHTAEQLLLDELVQDLAYALDVAEQDRVDLLNRQQLELAATVFDNSSEGISVTDTQGRIISVNRAFCEITGYQPDELLGQNPRLLKSGRHDRSFYQTMWRSLLEIGRWQGEIWNRRKDGEIYPELLSITAVKEPLGEISRYIAVFSDISGVKESQQQIDYLEWHDPLTDLPNRRMSGNHLSQAIDLARRREKSVALLCLDLDNFKDINDSFGHLTGDALLRLVARRLRDRLRSSDLVGRLGGDEFIVLLEELDQPEIVPLIAEDILALLQQPFQLDTGIELQTGVSIGIALFPDHGQTATELLQQADAALFQAKQQGRGRFAYYHDEMTEKARERVNLGNYLRRAVEKEELRVYYQPQVDAGTGRIIGAEALMRWQNPVLGLVSPIRFIPLAEEIGCIIQMGAWILRQTCLQGRQWLDQGLPPITLAVNLSPTQVHQPGLVTLVKQTLEATGYPPELLELELTESALMQHEEETIALLNDLRGLGVQLALDDFGTGYSSLAYLKHFPLNLLKVDKSFVDDLPDGAKDVKIVTTIVQMGKSLGFKLLAEGVEREEQRACLHSLGCNFYQGYLFSKPLPAEQFIDLQRVTR
ncbi:MAG: EAL domain-containing protein [Trichlorobacter sp.]|uniref:EAL domain-containing protein n=1 Tax=Trichlorobacter sp. TaxID=2911007 RepID=UPI0025688811|nr:EAL domain-containing protein [Trichlorobacter sp.]MDK9718132.1 EAL domain-containing protein [Trichlorobacter sp.]